MRRALTALFRRLLLIFFRRIEIVGAHNVPDSSPVIFAVNHPNGLVDPLFILGFVPRRVSFLAKAPLFRMPAIGYFVRTFDSIPVYRKQDNMPGTHAETFARAREVLGSGGAIAIFPEGTTHSDARLRELKTGAARIALGSALPDLKIVPAGIYYTEKQTFRSKALIAFGAPVAVERPPAAGVEPEWKLVEELTARIEAGLTALTLQADSHAALEIVAHAEDIFTSDGDQPLAEELELRRRFIAGYHLLRERDAARLARIESEIRRFVAELGRAGFEPHELVPRVPAGTIGRLLLLFPAAAAGIIAHYVPFRLVDWLSSRFSRNASELTATVKFVSALAIYPVAWLLVATLVWRWWGIPAAVATLAVLPFLGFAALRVMEDLDDAIGRLRAVIHRVFSRDAHAALLEQRRAIRQEIAGLAAELDVA
ncbi:MAG TPA: lysophospholipid acyltransferase family protein [Thermoanaerobaculia bacterium]|nr:lysophospholipid acyltransferase family protein [Thermoanaerobaculia bacterium]